MTLSQLFTLLTAIGGVALVVIPMVRPYIKDARIAKGLEILEKLASAAVGDRLKRVEDLKDPTKPGNWTAAAALSTKQSAVDDVVTIAHDVVEGLKKLGVDRPEYLIAQMIEREVAAQKVDTQPMPVTVVPPRPASIVTSGGNEP